MNVSSHASATVVTHVPIHLLRWAASMGSRPLTCPRNHLDAAITKRQLRDKGVELISAKENFGDGYMGDAMEAITDVVNELQVRMSGEDIRIKMAHKVERTELNAGLHDWRAQHRLSASTHAPTKEKRASRIPAEDSLSDLYPLTQSKGLNKPVLVGVKGLKPSTSRSQTERAINCATPRWCFWLTRRGDN